MGITFSELTSVNSTSAYFLQNKMTFFQTQSRQSHSVRTEMSIFGSYSCFFLFSGCCLVSWPCIYFLPFFLAVWSSVTRSWRQKWWASTKSWTRRGRSTRWRRSSCATLSVPRTTQSGGIRCCRKRWSSFSPRSVTSLRPAPPQPRIPADRIVTTPSGYSEGGRGPRAEMPVKTRNGLFDDVKGSKQDLAAGHKERRHVLI